MGKSRRFHKRVQKRHTRKDKPTRKKNKMKKNYSRKQRGGNPVGIAVAVGATLALGALLLNLANGPTVVDHERDPPSYKKDAVVQDQPMDTDKERDPDKEDEDDQYQPMGTFKGMSHESLLTSLG